MASLSCDSRAVRTCKTEVSRCETAMCFDKVWPGRSSFQRKLGIATYAMLKKMHVGFLVGRHVSILIEVVSWSYLQGARESSKVGMMDVYSYSAMIGRRDMCVSDFIPALLAS